MRDTTTSANESATETLLSNPQEYGTALHCDSHSTAVCIDTALQHVAVVHTSLIDAARYSAIL